MFRFILGLTLFAVALTVQAQAKGFYVSGSFGPNWDEDPPFAFVNEDTGLVGTIALGTHIAGVDGLRVELEASFRSHESTIGPITLEHDTTAVMANVVWDIDAFAMGRVVPFVLVGGGIAGTELTFGGLGSPSIENDGFGFQMGAGANYRITDTVSGGLQYRYASLPAVELFGFELDGGGNHALLATVNVALD